MAQEPRRSSEESVDDALSPEREFEADVLEQFGFDDEESVSEDTDAEDYEADGDSEAEYSEGEGDEEPSEEYGAAEEADQGSQQENFKIKSDQKGNLIDSNGKIVAKAGSERRLYEKNQKITRDYNELSKEYAENQELMRRATEIMRGQHEELQQLKAGTLQSQYNLSDQESREALEVYNKLKDPNTALDGAKYILTKLAQRGINIQSLGVGSGAIDPAVLSQGITSHIDQQLKPITEQHQAQLQEQQKREAAQREVQEFLRANPEAEQHRQTLGRILKDPRFRGMPLSEAWSRLQNYLLRQQLNGQQSQQSPTPTPEPRPSGRSRPTATSPRQRIDDSPVHADASYREIIRGVISDYGNQFE